MHVDRDLRRPAHEERDPVTSHRLGMGEPVAIVVEEVVTRPELQGLPAAEIVRPVVPIGTRFPPDVLVVDVREGVPAVRIEHRIYQDDGVPEHLHRGGIVPGSEMLQQLERSLRPRQLEPVNRPAEPDYGRLIGDQCCRLIGFQATRVGEPPVGRADRLEPGMVLLRRHDRHQERPSLPAQPQTLDRDAGRGLGEPLEVAHHLMVLGDTRTKSMPDRLLERRYLCPGPPNE